MSLKHHLNKLEYFYFVVQAKSILKASYLAGITQPQLSRVIRQLEDELGKQLLVRTPIGVEPTKEGVELYQLAETLIQQVGRSERKIKHGNSNIEGIVKVGTYDSIARYFFPSFLKFLKATSPRLEVHLETARSRQIFSKLKKNNLDIGVFVNSPSFKSRSLIVEEVYSDSFGFYHHPGITAEFTQQIILFPESADLKTGEEDDFLKTYNFSTSVLSDNLETVKSLAEEFVGIGLLPHRVAREAVMQGKLVSLKRQKNIQPISPHQVVLGYQKGGERKEVNSIVTELARFLSSWSKN